MFVQPYLTNYYNIHWFEKVTAHSARIPYTHSIIHNKKNHHHQWTFGNVERRLLHVHAILVSLDDEHSQLHQSLRLDAPPGIVWILKLLIFDRRAAQQQHSAGAQTHGHFANTYTDTLRIEYIHTHMDLLKAACASIATQQRDLAKSGKRRNERESRISIDEREREGETM